MILIADINNMLLKPDSEDSFITAWQGRDVTIPRYNIRVDSCDS